MKNITVRYIHAIKYERVYTKIVLSTTDTRPEQNRMTDVKRKNFLRMNGKKIIIEKRKDYNSRKSKLFT